MVELLRCAADESLRFGPWTPIANLVDVARLLDMQPFDQFPDTNDVIDAWRLTGRVWSEGNIGWVDAMLEAAQRVEDEEWL